MKKIAFFSVFLLLGGILTIAALSSFRGQSQPHFQRDDITHFKFNEVASPTESNLENTLYWEVSIDEPSNPCTSGTNAPCIIHVDNQDAGIDSQDSDSQKVAKLVAFLISLESNFGMSAQTFVSTPGNFDFQRQ